MSKFRKIEKEFRLTDSTVNSYGFRLMTEGYQVDEFKKNAIGYYMHARESGVLVKWEDLRQDGDAWYGKPVINMSHPRATQTIDEIENGFLNAASVGHLIVLETSDAPESKLPNQAGPTVTKWYNRECSLVDIPGNFNSLALFDAHENPINLADFTKGIKSMEKIIFTPTMLSAMNLKADANQSMAEAAFNAILDKSKKADELQTKLNDLAAKSNEDRVKAILDGAKEAKKLTVEVADKLAASFKENPDGLKDLIDSMPAYQSITSQLGADNASKEEIAALNKMSMNELLESGKLADLKAKAPDLYEQKFEKEYGRKPNK